MGGSTEALASVLKLEDKLTFISRQSALDGSLVLGQILDYQRKFKTLPTWIDLEDHITGQQQNAGILSEFEVARKAIEEDHDDVFMSLDVLIGHLEEHVKGAILRHKLKIASSIAGTGWEDPKTKKKLMGADTACAWIANCAGADEDNSVLEEGEKTIAQGRDGVETFTMTTICADTIKLVAIKWLWPEHFPLGKLALITGKPDNGKSQVTISVVACTTTGRDWPDGSKNTLGPRDVLMAVAEDDLADTVIPRLMAAGADLSRVHFVGCVRTKEFDEKNGTKSVVRPLQLAADIKKLKIAIESNPQIALIVIDTVTSFFGDVNVNADQDIRPVMDGLAKAFRDCGAAFIGISHHNKKNDADAVQAILGASSVAGSVRAAYSCSRDPENEGEFYFALVKGNLTKKRDGMKFTIAEKLMGDILAPYVEWGDVTDKDANAVMALVKESRDGKNQQIDKARLFLPMALEKGPRLARELFNEAKAEGISEQQLKRAKYELKDIQTSKRKDGWIWYLPGKAQEKTFLVDEVEL